MWKEIIEEGREEFPEFVSTLLSFNEGAIRMLPSKGEEKVKYYNEKFDGRIPEDYLTFLKTWNGGNLFDGDFVFSGVMVNYPELKSQYPDFDYNLYHDIFTDNEELKGMGVPEDGLIIANYPWGDLIGIYLKGTPKEGLVYRFDHEGGDVTEHGLFREWLPSFVQDFVESFTADGKLKTPEEMGFAPDKELKHVPGWLVVLIVILAFILLYVLMVLFG